jgi:hypothetical protein
MNPRRWLVLVLVVLIGSTARPVLRAEAPAKLSRPSHLPIDVDLGNLDPEARLAERLIGSRDKLRKFTEHKELADLVKDLLKNNPELVEKLGKSISPRDIERLKQGQGFDSKALEGLLKESQIDKLIKPEDRDRLANLAKTLKGEQGSTIPLPSNPEPVKPPMPPTPPTGPTLPATQEDPSKRTESWSGLPEKPPEWLRDRLDGWVKDVEGWAGSSGSETVRGILRELAKRKPETSTVLPALGERARGMGRFIPRVTGILPRNVLPRPPRVRLPSLPNIASLPAAPRLGGGPSLRGAGRVLLWCAVLGVLAFLLWRAGGWWQRRRAALLAAGWQLGPWPVRPEDVCTRSDLVRAFEHLALLLLGPAARTCNHLELAGRMGEQPAFDAEHRRDAAADLARLYEQARYTPDDETLAPETMSRARRELSYLAGVAAA